MYVDVKIPEQAIADMMVTVIEGNHMVRAWCSGVRLVSHQQITWKHPWYSDPRVWLENFVLEVDEFSDEEGKHHTHRIRIQNFKDGIARMAETDAKHFGDWLNEDYDIVTADVWFQHIVLGEVRYG